MIGVWEISHSTIGLPIWLGLNESVNKDDNTAVIEVKKTAQERYLAVLEEKKKKPSVPVDLNERAGLLIDIKV